MAVDSFTLASWNVHTAVANDGGVVDVLARCRDLDADVLVLQEAWWNLRLDSMTERIAQRLGYELHEYAAPRSDAHRALKRRGWQVSVLSRLASRPAGVVALPEIPRTSPRGIQLVELTDLGVMVGGAHIYGVHGLRRSPPAAIRELKALSSVLDRVDLVAGDLNMWASVIDRLPGPARRAVRGRTWPAPRPHSQIDHILAGPRLEVVASEVMCDWGSDHRAVRAELKVLNV